jgi:protein TonB
MKAASLIMHVVLGVAILVLPITASIELPRVFTALPPVVIATVAPLPPAPQPVTAPTTVPQVATVPMEAPAGIAEEKEAPVSAVPPVPGGLPGVGIGSTLLVPMGGASISIASPPAPAPQEPRRVGGDIKPPERTIYKAPQYPPAAQAARIEGTVTLEAIIDAEGVVQNVKVLGSVPLLDRAAVEAVQQWRYTPTRLNGVAIPIIMTVRVTFTLK